MPSLNGVALVTGGGAGLGRACALTLGQRGARVAVHYMKSRSGAEEVAAMLKAAGSEAHPFQGDLTKSADVTTLVNAVTARFGAIDILVNNAGDLIERKPLLEMSDELFHAVMDVNVTSVFLMCRAVARGMVSRKRGTIVNMSSLAAWNGGGPGAGAYSAAKGDGVSRALYSTCRLRERRERRAPRARGHAGGSRNRRRLPRLAGQLVPDGRDD
jgi:3-oxoacyl-[acyl-carrier protein] reductase